MKKLTTFIAAVLCCMAFAFADPCEGYWKSIDDGTNKVTAFWKVYVENDTLYGKIVHVPDQDDSTIASACKSSYKGFPVEGDVSKMTVVNTPFIYNMKNKAEGKWEKGNIVDPSNGNCYTCTMTYHKADGGKYKVDTLEMRGSIGPIGKSQFWQKTSKAEAEAGE